MKKALKFVGNFLFYGFLIACVCVSLSVFQAMRQGVQPSFLGYKFFVVLTGSMSPTLDVGDLVIVKDTEPEAIAVGDVITYSVGNDNVVTHRVKEIVTPRQIAMYLSRELTDASFPKIGSEFGGKDHTTVLHAHEKITNLIEIDSQIKREINELKEKM